LPQWPPETRAAAIEILADALVADLKEFPELSV
jgi:hypothetical protein